MWCDLLHRLQYFVRLCDRVYLALKVWVMWKSYFRCYSAIVRCWLILKTCTILDIVFLWWKMQWLNYRTIFDIWKGICFWDVGLQCVIVIKISIVVEWHCKKKKEKGKIKSYNRRSKCIQLIFWIVPSMYIRLRIQLKKKRNTGWFFLWTIIFHLANHKPVPSFKQRESSDVWKYV